MRSVDLNGYAGLPSSLKNKPRGTTRQYSRRAAPNNDEAVKFTQEGIEEDVYDPRTPQEKARRAIHNAIANDSSKMKNLMATVYTGELKKDTTSDDALAEVWNSELGQLTASGPRRQTKEYVFASGPTGYYMTDWVPGQAGMMEFQHSLKPGTSVVELNFSDVDKQATYVIKRNQYQHQTLTSSLQFDRFLTVSNDADRFDKPPTVRNREAPLANEDPFEQWYVRVDRNQSGNLNRLLIPREDSEVLEKLPCRPLLP